MCLSHVNLKKNLSIMIITVKKASFLALGLLAPSASAFAIAPSHNTASSRHSSSSPLFASKILSKFDYTNDQKEMTFGVVVCDMVLPPDIAADIVESDIFSKETYQAGQKLTGLSHVETHMAMVEEGTIKVINSGETKLFLRGDWFMIPKGTNYTLEMDEFQGETTIIRIRMP